MTRLRDHGIPIDPVIEAYNKDVDRALIRKNLERRVEQRFEQRMDLQRFAENLQAAAK